MGVKDARVAALAWAKSILAEEGSSERGKARD